MLRVDTVDLEPTTAVLTIAYLGNFDPEHSTENHVARAMVANGHRVVPIQEGRTRATDVVRHVADANADMLWWTQTYGLAEQGGDAIERAAMLGDIHRAGIPTVGFHLDRWWGLDREDQVAREPFFSVDLVVTADGGHDEQWASLGIDHVWLPPGVSAAECAPIEPDPTYAADVVFVGNWTRGYHREWTHRQQLVRWLRSRYRGRVRFWPRPGAGAVRGVELRKLYATAKVVVGDSCLVGDATRYWSDRIPETLGRGGFLLHPWVDGIDEHFTDGEHLRLWQLGDWRQLATLIDHYLSAPDLARQIAERGRAHVIQHHTYEVRVRQVIDIARDRGLL